MPLIGFDQDPEGPPGAGMFHFDDRPSLPAYSPNDAAPFMQAPEQQTDQRLAMSNPADVYKNPAVYGETDYVNPDSRSVADVAPDMTGGQSMPQQISEAPHQSPAPMVSQAPPPVASPPAASPPIAPQPAAPRPVSPIGVQPSSLPSAQQAIGTAQGVPRGMQVQSIDRTTETMGKPVTPEDREARAEASINKNLTDQEIAARQADYHAQVAQAAGEQAKRLQQQVAHDKMVAAHVRAEYRSKRDDIQKEVDAAGEKKVDPNKFFSDRGALSQILIMLGQAMGAYAATLGHTPNFVQQQIDKAIDNDIAAQRDNIAQDGAKAKNKLASLMRDYDLDIDDASSILRNSQQQLADQQAMALAHATKQQDIIDAWQKDIAGRAEQRVMQEQKIEDDHAGKTIQKIDMRRKVGKVMNPILRNIVGSEKEAEALQRQFYIDHPEAKPADFLKYAQGIAHSKGEAGQTGGLGQRLATAVSKGELADNRVIRLGKDLGAEFDEKTHRFKVPEGVGGYLGGKVRGAVNAVQEKAGLAGARPAVRTQAEAALSTVLAAGQGRSDETDKEARDILETSDPRAFAQRANEALDEKDAFEKAAYKHGSKTGHEREDEE
jgi:hypothetical protein